MLFVGLLGLLFWVMKIGVNARKKLSLIGGGNIGGTIALLASARGDIDVVLYDIKGDLVKGKALDIMQMNALLGVDSDIVGTDDISQIAGSDAIIITAGSVRKPGQSREDLLSINIGVIKSIAQSVKEYAPNAFVVVVTNPLDAMVYFFKEFSGLPSNKVAGMAGMLDTARFKLFLSKEFGVCPADVGAVVLGGHGDSMVPVVGSSTIMGVGIEQLVKQGFSTKERIDEIVERTRVGGAEIAKLMAGVGSAFYAPALASLQMVLPYLFGHCRLMTASVFLNGEYGVKDLCVGVPVMIGAGGAEKVLEIDLSADEKVMFEKSVGVIREVVDAGRLLM